MYCAVTMSAWVLDGTWGMYVDGVVPGRGSIAADDLWCALERDVFWRRQCRAETSRFEEGKTEVAKVQTRFCETTP